MPECLYITGNCALQFFFFFLLELFAQYSNSQHTCVYAKAPRERISRQDLNYLCIAISRVVILLCHRLHSMARVETWSHPGSNVGALVPYPCSERNLNMDHLRFSLSRTRLPGSLTHREELIKNAPCSENCKQSFSGCKAFASVAPRYDQQKAEPGPS